MNIEQKVKLAAGASLLASLVAFSSTTHAALSYSQDFESLDPNSATALSGDGWFIGNCLVGGGCWFGPGNEAPNSPASGVNGYSALVTDQGGVGQGGVQLSVYSDYNPWSSFGGAGSQTLETFVYRDIGIIGAGDANQTIQFNFDVKQGNIGDSTLGSQAWAYINVIKVSDSSFATLYNGQFETTTVGTDWISGSLDVTIDASWAGELLQIGFKNTTTEWDASGVVYDNLSVAAVPVLSLIHI